MLCGATQLRSARANCKVKVQFTRDFETFLFVIGAKRRSQMSTVCLGYTTKNQWIRMQTSCIWLWLANCSSTRCNGGMVLEMKKVFIMGSITIGEQQKYAELTMDWCPGDYSKRFGDKTVKSNIASGQVVGINGVGWWFLESSLFCNVRRTIPCFKSCPMYQYLIMVNLLLRRVMCGACSIMVYLLITKQLRCRSLFSNRL